MASLGGKIVRQIKAGDFVVVMAPRDEWEAGSEFWDALARFVEARRPGARFVVLPDDWEASIGDDELRELGLARV